MGRCPVATCRLDGDRVMTSWSPPFDVWVLRGVSVRTVVTFIESPLRVYVNRKCNDQTLRDMEELQEERVAALIGARVVSVGGEKA